MNTAIKKYSVAILNESYSLVSDESEMIVMAAASRIDALMRDITQKGIDPKRAGVLAALKISLELVKLQEKYSISSTSLDQLLQEIDRVLA